MEPAPMAEYLRGVRRNQQQGMTAAVRRNADVHYRQPRQRSRLVRPPIPPYYRQLLDAAARYRADREYAVAVIIAQTACELVAEWAFETFLGDHNLTERDQKNLTKNFNVANDRVKALYVVLSGDRIDQQPFWPDLRDHADRRNKIVHKGEKATAKDADASIRAATELISHVESVLAHLSAL
jgi:hypothetical protein